MSFHYEEVYEELRKNSKTWLVTGVAGFIGSNILEQLLKLDQQVVGIDNFFSGKRQNLDEVKKLVSSSQWGRFNFIEGDIRNTEDCDRVCKGVDIIIHQAAIGSVPRSIEKPDQTNDSNITGHLNMLIAAHKAGIKRFVYASSSSVYGDHPGLPKVEDQIGNPLSPYAISKYVDELYSNVYHSLHGLETVGLRYFNVFGPRQDPEGAYAAVIPKWLSAMINKKPVAIFGDGKTSRDFCFVDNVVQVNILGGTTTNPEAFGKAYNVACGERTDLNELFEHLRSGLENDFDHLKDLKPDYQDERVGDVKHSHANISRAQELLGYEPTIKIGDGLAHSMSWYKENLS